MIRSTNLPAKVRAFLMSQKRERWDSGFRKGRLDTGRLTEVLRGKEDLFKQRAPIHMTNSAVSLLLDCSGSMSGRRYNQAVASASMLAEALQGVGVNLEIAGFTEFSNLDNGLVHEIFLPFGQRFVRDTFLRKAGGMAEHLSNNADGENILYAYQRLKTQPQGRKILIVLSDGEPAAQGPSGATMEIQDFTKQTIEMIERDKSVKLVSLGMDGYDTGRFYKNAIKVEYGQHLEKVLLDMVKNSVLS
jgi:cobalamin biosynthesis protein CobT